MAHSANLDHMGSTQTTGRICRGSFAESLDAVILFMFTSTTISISNGAPRMIHS